MTVAKLVENLVAHWVLWKAGCLVGKTVGNLVVTTVYWWVEMMVGSSAEPMDASLVASTVGSMAVC